MTQDQIDELAQIAAKNPTVHRLLQVRHHGLETGRLTDHEWACHAVVALAKEVERLQQVAVDAVMSMGPARFDLVALQRLRKESP